MPKRGNKDNVCLKCGASSSLVALNHSHAAALLIPLVLIKAVFRTQVFIVFTILQERRLAFCLTFRGQNGLAV